MLNSLALVLGSLFGSFGSVFGKGLKHFVAIYVPSTVNVDKALDENTANAAIESALRFLSTQFGGATALRANGGWVASDGSLVTESVTVVYAYAAKLSRQQLRDIKAYALGLKAQLGQEAIAVAINRKLHFV